MSVAVISYKRPGATVGGYRVPEGSDVPLMRPRTGKRGTDDKLISLLNDVLEDLAATPCCFWACQGPSRPRHMCTCRKCWSMRSIATVAASLAARQNQPAKGT